MVPKLIMANNESFNITHLLVLVFVWFSLCCFVSCEKDIYIDIEESPESLEVIREISSIERYMELTAVSSHESVQGCALWDKSLFVFHNTNDYVDVYDVSNKLFKCSVDMMSIGLCNREYHCNNVNFSNVKYDNNDTYPLMYVSMEHINQHKILVLRANEQNDAFKFDLIQIIDLPHPDSISLYYPNAYIDSINHSLWVSGYSTDNYNARQDNHLKYLKFDLPDFKLGELITLQQSDIKQVCVFDSVSSTQGGLIKDGRLHQVFGITSPLYYIIFDLETNTMLYRKEISVFNSSEPEGFFFMNDAPYYSTQNSVQYFIIE